jgi:hypothetical protein
LEPTWRPSAETLHCSVLERAATPPASTTTAPLRNLPICVEQPADFDADRAIDAVEARE